MRRALFVIVLGLTATAAAAPPGRAVRKPAPPNISGEILNLFVDGIVADKAGDLTAAARRYDDAIDKSPQANIYYNLADVERRMEKLPKAIKSYKKYLELAPTAPDRKEVEKLIAQLERTEFVVVVDGEDLDGVVFFDGKLIGPSPQVLRVPTGKHVVERLSPTGYRHRSFEAKPMEVEHFVMSVSESEARQAKGPPGNVILSASAEINTSGSWDTQGVRFHMSGRFSLPPGHYETLMWNDKRTCNPIVFDVPKGGELIHVYVEGEPRPKDGGCQRITTRQQKVKVAQ